MVFNLFEDNQKLRVTLSSEDLKKFNITAEEIHYNTTNTRKIITKILTEAKEVTGFKTLGKILLIEIFQNNKNGCEIYFSLLKDRKNFESINNTIFGNYSFEYNNIDLLVDSSIKLFEMFSHKIFQSSLYVDTKSKKYFLTLVTIDPKNTDIISFLKEFSKFRSNKRDFQLFIDEHYHLIIKNNAIEVIFNNF